MKKNRKATHKNWGGRRAGAGRPPGSGTGPRPDSRQNRVAVMFNKRDLLELKRLARDERIPVATAAFQVVERALKSRRVRRLARA